LPRESRISLACTSVIVGIDGIGKGLAFQRCSPVVSVAVTYVYKGMVGQLAK
jgi:hypothetical protein